MPNGPPGDDPPRPDAPLCEHLRTTRSGTNAYYNMLRCLDCGHVLQRERRTATTTTATPKAAGSVGSVFNPKNVGCPHHSVSWTGTNAIQRFPLATNLLELLLAQRDTDRLQPLAMDFRPRALVMDFLLRRLDLACSDQCESLPFRCSFR